jgi:dipeptidyl aminopeptidase/acylaminoacyl peptidase
MTLDYRAFIPEQRFQPAIAISPDASTVAYSGNASGQFNLWLHPLDGGAPRQLTSFTQSAVREIAWTPDGNALIFTADRDGDEQYQIYRVPAEDGQPEPLTTADGQHRLGAAPFDPTGRYLTYTANDRDIAVQDLVIRDLENGEERRFTPPQGEMFMQPMTSPDGSQVLIAGVRSNTEADIYLITLNDSDDAPRRVTDGDGFYWPQCWAPDSQSFYLSTMMWSEFIAAARCSVKDGDIQPVIQSEWNVEQVAAAGDVLAWTVNEVGRSVLHARLDGADCELPVLPSGVIGAVDLSSDGSLIAIQIDAATRPTEIAVIDLADDTFRYLTDVRPPGLRTVEPIEPAAVTYASRDGRTIHAWAYRPHGPGPFPALLWIHGGPEDQERPGYGRSGLYQYLLAKGIAVFAPNVAGSYGYGRSFQTSIYRDWGGIDLRDFEDTIDHLRGVDWIDDTLVAVAGGSYGGFAALSCLSRIDFPWAAGISLCGPSNLVTLARACPPTWRHYVDVIIGNPEADAESLMQRSPVTYADQIKAPLFVLQGAHDPRVPRAEADQIVERLRSRGVEVRYDVYPDEGHGFTNRHNENKAYSDAADFLLTHLGGKTSSTRRGE